MRALPLTLFEKSLIAFLALRELPRDHARFIAEEALTSSRLPGETPQMTTAIGRVAREYRRSRDRGGGQAVSDKFDRREDVRRTLERDEDIDRAENVHELRPNVGKLKQHAQALLAKTESAGDITAVVDRPYLIKGWLDQGNVSLLFGPSNTGKSFLAANIAHHVSKGMDWGGRRVRRGRVMYVAAEGGANFRNRVAALDDPEFWVMTSSLTMTGPRSAERPFVEVLKHIADTGGAPFDLIIFDTLARIMGGSDENAAPDIADLLEKLDYIQMETRAHIMLIHHVGKDAGRGARGHSSLKAAVDTEIELTRDKAGLIEARLTKQRDGPTGYKFPFFLKQVELGRDSDGDQVTTCLVEPAETAGAVRAVSDSAQRAFEILDRLLQEKGRIERDPSYPGTPCIDLEDWREACVEDDGVSTAPGRPNRLRAFYRARDSLLLSKWILVRDELVWRVTT